MSQTVLLLFNPVASHASTFCSLLNFVQQPTINVATINNTATPSLLKTKTEIYHNHQQQFFYVNEFTLSKAL